jgi:hypothetical protein
MLAMNYSTEIRSIMSQAYRLNAEIDAHRKANGHDGEYRRLFRRREDSQHGQDDLRRQAAQEFAALNGWRWTAHPFLARTLARGGTHEGRRDGGGGWGTFGVRDETIDGWMHHVLFDHPLFFREIARPYRTAAIVGQPYDTEPAAAIVHAAGFRRICHVPPNYLASWWYPGWTRFFCLTRPEVARVQFLSEQLEKPERNRDHTR